MGLLLLILTLTPGYCTEATMEATWEDIMVDTIPTIVVLPLAAREGRLRLTLGCCMVATMEDTLEAIMGDTILIITVLFLDVRGGRQPLSLLLTLRLTLGCCIMEDSIEDTLDTMEDTMALPILLESKRLPQQMTMSNSFTRISFKSSKKQVLTNIQKHFENLNFDK